MYRSVSTTRLEGNEVVLPVYEQGGMSSSDVLYRKDKSRAKFAEKAVHLIPFVLFLCAFVLWFFSNPDVDLPVKGDTIAARIEGLTLGDIDSDGTQRGVLPDSLDLGDVLNDNAAEDDHNPLNI